MEKQAAETAITPLDKKTDEVIAKAIENEKEGVISEVEGDIETETKESEDFSISEQTVEKCLTAIITMTKEEAQSVLEKEGIDKSYYPLLKKRFESGMRDIFSKDLESVKRAYPFVDAENLEEIENFPKYYRLRQNGFDAVEAFEAVNSRSIIDFKVTNQGDKTHLRSKQIVGKHIGTPPIPDGELQIWKSAFPKDDELTLKKRYWQNKL